MLFEQDIFVYACIRNERVYPSDDTRILFVFDFKRHGCNVFATTERVPRLRHVQAGSWIIRKLCKLLVRAAMA